MQRLQIADEQAVSSYQGTHYDTPNQTEALVPDMEVEKSAGTTRHTAGRVLGQLHGVHGVQYSAPLYGFNGVVFFDPVFAIAGKTDVFSDGGDLGSLITTVDTAGNRTAVGDIIGDMIDGSAPGGKVTLALPIRANSAFARSITGVRPRR